MARADGGGETRLVAYRGGRARRRSWTATCAAPCARSLPEYMVPTAMVVLPALPLTPSGKVDRKALPAPELRPESAPSRCAPRTPLEAWVAGLWREVLGIEAVGVHDDFFALGGTSISGAVLINRLQQELGEIVHVVVIFDQPTVARLAAYLAAQHAASPRRGGSGSQVEETGASEARPGRVDDGPPGPLSRRPARAAAAAGGDRPAAEEPARALRAGAAALGLARCCA